LKSFNSLLLILLALCACAKAGVAQEPRPAVDASAQDTTRKVLVQPGFGTLKQDEFTLGIRSGALLVKVTPLNERVIRLAAPDTYNRLHALAESRRADAAARVSSQEPELFLVSFFSYQPDVTFQPEDVQLDYNGKLLRAGAILPLTSSWGKQRMDQQETQTAIYVFADRIDFELPLIVKYGTEQNMDWQRVIPKLEVERSKIASRQQKTN
jgi:hypothetical protein